MPHERIDLLLIEGGADTQAESLYTDLEMAMISRFVVDGLVLSVAERQLDRDRAADLLATWFPGNKLALAALYKEVAHLRPPAA